MRTVPNVIFQDFCSTLTTLLLASIHKLVYLLYHEMLTGTRPNDPI